jgi:histidinol-phosphate aminotransferase
MDRIDIKYLVRPELLTMKDYTPIEPTDVLSQKTQLPGEKIIKLDGNENPYGCSPLVYQALVAYPYYHNYPDPEQRELREALERYTGIGRDHIVCGMGSDELIDLVLRLFLNPGDEVINCPPTFGMYAFSTNICGGQVINVPRKEDFSLDLAGIIKALSPKTKVIFIASPNNPTGNVTREEEIVELVSTDKVVVVDEAYFEFSNVTVAHLVPRYPNLMVLRTFSKWAGLAGFRIGYGIFPLDVARYLMRIKLPYNVNAAARLAALASLADLEYLRNNITKIINERERLFHRLQGMKQLTPYPSQANFILCSVTCASNSSCTNDVPVVNARRIWRLLRNRGIFVRYFDVPELQQYLRISVGKPEENQALAEALESIIKSGGS